MQASSLLCLVKKVHFLSKANLSSFPEWLILKSAILREEGWNLTPPGWVQKTTLCCYWGSSTPTSLLLQEANSEAVIVQKGAGLGSG